MKRRQGLPQARAQLQKVPVVENKSLAKGKRNCCNGSLEASWLSMRLVLQPWGAASFPPTQGKWILAAAAPVEQREPGLTGELVAAAAGILQ